LPFNGSGTYSAPSLPGTWNPAQSGSSIDPTDWNTLLTDLATALSKQICNDGQSTVAANIPFATHRITGLGNPVGVQDAVTLSFLQATPWSYLGGLGTSWASATTLSVAAGFAVNSTNLIGIPLAAAMTKSTAGAWASGSNSNGMGNGLTIANTTWYHVFAIINTGVADVYFDTSVTAANKPTSTTAFRRIGSFLTDGSAQIIAFIQSGDLFLWKTPVNSYSATGGGATVAMAVPPGVNVLCVVGVLGTVGSPGARNIIVYSPLQNAQTPNGVSGNDHVSWGPADQQGAGRFEILTDTSQNIVVAADSSTNLFMSTIGWIDRRGRDS
jgi:hypothetical protein